MWRGGRGGGYIPLPSNCVQSGISNSPPGPLTSREGELFGLDEKGNKVPCFCNKQILSDWFSVQRAPPPFEGRGPGGEFEGAGMKIQDGLCL